MAEEYHTHTLSGSGTLGGNRRRGSESPLVCRPAPTTPIEQQAPAPHTGQELETIMAFLSRRGSYISAISVGHARDEASRSAANAVIRAWTDRGDEVLGVVDWPEDSASWLRQARRLAAGAPDAWVVAGSPLGFAQMARRLRHSTDWDPKRTIAFSSLADIRLIEMADDKDCFRSADGLGGAYEHPENVSDETIDAYLRPLTDDPQTAGFFTLWLPRWARS